MSEIACVCVCVMVREGARSIDNQSERENEEKERERERGRTEEGRKGEGRNPIRGVVLLVCVHVAPWSESRASDGENEIAVGSQLNIH